MSTSSRLPGLLRENEAELLREWTREQTQALPGMSGVDLAHGALQLRTFLPFIFVSGQLREVLPDFGSLEQDHPLLVKPFSPDVLATCVRARLDSRSTSGSPEDDRVSAG